MRMARAKSLMGRTIPSQPPQLATAANHHHDDIFWWNSRITSFFRSGYPDAARRCFDEMPRRNRVTWNCMISGYARDRNVDMARKVFDEMTDRDVVSWGALLSGYVRSGRLAEAREVFDGMPERNVICWNSMMTGYVEGGKVEAARELFDAMQERSNASWAIMISGYLRHRFVDEARALLDRAPGMDCSQYNSVLSRYVELGRYDDALGLFNQMEQRDAVSWNMIITCYLRAGKIVLARLMFDDMPAKDVVSWTTMIRGYLVSGDVDAARMLFDKMPERDVVAWNTMIGGYVQNEKLEEALRLFEEMPVKDVVSWNSILQGYVQKDDMSNALFWFNMMPEKDETSWNTLISGYRNEEALVHFCRMTRNGFRPDQGTFTVMISVCGSLSALVWGRIMHLYATKVGYENDTLVSSSLITMYSKCGLVADSMEVFDRARNRDSITWNAMLVALACHGFSTEAFSLFHAMVRANFQPDHVTFLGLLSVCAHNGLINEGLIYFECMQKTWKLTPKPEHYASIVDLLGRSGSIRTAFEFIKKVPADSQTNTWETLLSSCRVHGNLDLAEIAAKKILGTQPFNDGMYVILCNIYAAKGMWEDAAGIRTLMRHLGVKKEAACSWIEVKGKTFIFGYDDKSHPQTKNIYRTLDSLQYHGGVF